MSNKPPTVLNKLAEYEAANISTQPLYDEWSQTYEQDLIGNLGYTGHLIAANALAEFVSDKTASVIDIGCGTGLVGCALKTLSYSHIDGIDFSEEMLNIARPKKVYQKLISGDLMSRTVIETNAYQAAVCAGSFAPGHLEPKCYPEIIRLVQPDSPIVIFMNAVYFLEENYQSHIDQLERSKVWEIIAIKTFNYMSAVERPGRLIIARKC